MAAFTSEQITDRIERFKDLERQGLVSREPDGHGGAFISFPQPDHPEVLALFPQLRRVH